MEIIEEAKMLMNELKERSLAEYIGGILFGLSAAYLGDLDTAFEYLNKAFDDRDTHLIIIKYSPYVPALLKNDPRFKNLLDRIGFPK